MNDPHQPYENPSLPLNERVALVGYDYESLTKTFSESCNLCGGATWTVLTHRDRYGHLAQTTACHTCGLSVLNPRINSEDYTKFYIDVYRPLISAYYGRRIDAKTVQGMQTDYSIEMARVVRPYFQDQKGSKFLDVGGSTGIIAVHFAKEFGIIPVVLDPAPDEIAEADALGLETITALVEDWDPGDIKYERIGMFQTIDHLLDVKATLDKLRAVITDDGIFVVDVVDFRASYLKNWSVEKATKVDHPFSLTEETAEAYLIRSGFNTVRKAYSEDHHLVTYICEPSEPNPDYLPSPESVDRFFREVRYVQSAPCGAGRTE